MYPGNYSLNDFAGCCGATVIDFHDDSESDVPSCRDEHIYLVILIDYQLKRIGAKLKKAGFRLVSNRVRNSSTGNRLYLFVRDKMPVRKKLKKRTFR